MKICFYNLTAGYKTGGLETYCWEVAHILAQRGHDVTIVGGQGGSARYSDVSLVQFPYRERSTFPMLGSRFRKLAERLSFGRHAVSHLATAGYDVVIVTKPYDLPVVWRARRHGATARIVMSSGGTDYFMGDRFFARSVDCWVSASHFNARQVEAHYHHAVTAIHNGVDTEKFRPQGRNAALRNRWGVPENAPLIISTARLIGWKGLHVVIEALNGLPDIHYVLAGDGPERLSLEGKARELGIDNRVHFLGDVGHQSLPEVLSQADIFVQPSIGDETFGISLVEAMACGLPVLASRNGGMPEIVVENETGLLLPAGDVAAWCKAIAETIVSPELIRRMGEAGRQRAEGEFTWSACALKLEQVLCALK